jgi:Na+:H+ antiporter, NhaA family
MSDPIRPDFPNLRHPQLWLAARRGVRRIVAPVERFLAIETASGIILLAAAAAALIWANSPWRTAYLDVWHIPAGIGFGGFAFERDLRFWMNEGLMTIFFFVVGLEIRREVHAGELSDIRRAALPLAAAFGGMLAPALIFFALNAGRESARGWAIPVATDIAFAVGVLALLGNRVPRALRILLLALAVIDDVGAIAVIALFYSSAIVPLGFAILLAGVLAVFAFQALGVRSSWAYVAPSLVVWSGAYIAGIHPTLAGVMVGFMTPIAVLPRLEHRLHRWVAFAIMPLFAFANAGIPLGQIDLGGDGWLVFLGVALGLAVGKPVGILAVSWLAVRSGIAALPNAIGWSHIGVLGIVGGIGFTMALFITQLAFPSGVLLETAKLAVLCGSGLAGVLSMFVGYAVLKRSPGRS